MEMRYCELILSEQFVHTFDTSYYICIVVTGAEVSVLCGDLSDHYMYIFLQWRETWRETKLIIHAYEICLVFVAV